MIEWFETQDGDKWCAVGGEDVMFRTIATEDDSMTTYITKETLLEMLKKLEETR